MNNTIEKRYYKPSEASKILGVSNAHLCKIMAVMGYKREWRVSKDQLEMCRKYLIFRKWLKNKPYNLGLLRLISHI